MEKLKIGYAPTRRFTFSAEDARRYKDLIYKFMQQYDSIEIVDIDDINKEGLLYDSTEMANRVSEKFIANKVDRGYGRQGLQGSRQTGSSLGPPRRGPA